MIVLPSCELVSQPPTLYQNSRGVLEIMFKIKLYSIAASPFVQAVTFLNGETQCDDMSLFMTH